MDFSKILSLNVSTTDRQKRKLDEMYDLARTEAESLKRSAIMPSNLSLSEEPDLFSNPTNRIDNRDTIRRGNPLLFQTFSRYNETYIYIKKKRIISMQ